jgi:hypothetical protein
MRLSHEKGAHELNLAQDAALDRDSRDEKSRRDDWKLADPGPHPMSAHL